MNLADLEKIGFDVETHNHALAILSKDFPVPMAELCGTLARIEIADVELIRSGGGEAQATRRLRRVLSDQGWRKRKIVIRKTVDGRETAAISHEIDHVRRTEQGSVALEIEWNNKDPFFDRDLENFQRLHAEGAISVGIVITRGSSLQEELRRIVLDCIRDHGIEGYDGLRTFGVQPTARQREIVKRNRQSGRTFADAWSRQFTTDKFGTATTHWSKLQERIARGVGNPCPLLLLGIPSTAIKRTKEDTRQPTSR